MRADAYIEAWERGKSWQEAVAAGLAAMPDLGRHSLASALGVPVEELGKAKE
jgi:hypothetical protein